MSHLIYWLQNNSFYYEQDYYSLTLIAGGLLTYKVLNKILPNTKLYKNMADRMKKKVGFN